jgi:hypothetical protein
MPAETHQRGRPASSEEIMLLLSTLLDQNAGGFPKNTTLVSLGLADDPNLWDLWDAVREEYGERTLGPDAAEALDPHMTLEEAAAVMARLLTPGDAEAGTTARDQGAGGR